MRTLRTKLGLDPFAFSAVLGVHVSSIYRWESSDAPRIDRLQREILIGLYERKLSRTEGADLGKSVRDALVGGGTLSALHVLLAFITNKDTDHG